MEVSYVCSYIPLNGISFYIVLYRLTYEFPAVSDIDWKVTIEGHGFIGSKIARVFEAWPWYSIPPQFHYILHAIVHHILQILSFVNPCHCNPNGQNRFALVSSLIGVVGLMSFHMFAYSRQNIYSVAAATRIYTAKRGFDMFWHYPVLKRVVRSNTSLKIHSMDVPLQDALIRLMALLK